jgi:nitrogen regulatory protein PII
VTEIVNGGGCEDPKVDDAQQELAERKSNLKKVKSRCKTVREEMESVLAQTLRKREELQAEVARLTELLEEQGDTASAQADVEEMESRIAQKNEALKAQEEALRILNTEKLEIEVAVRADLVDQVTEAIVKAAKTGKVGDGKIFITDIDRVVRIRTGETDESAL